MMDKELKNSTKPAPSWGAWALLALGLGATLADSLGWIERLAPYITEPKHWLLLGGLVYGPLIYAAWAIETGRPAPALRGRAAPWVLLGLAQFGVRLSGGQSQAFFVAQALVILLLTRQRGLLSGAALAAAAVAFEAAALFRVQDATLPWPPTAVWDLAAPALAWALGSLLRSNRVETPLRQARAGATSSQSSEDLALAEEVPVIDPLEQYWRNAAAIVDLAWHANPHWNGTTLWWMDGKKASLRLHRLRNGQVRLDAELGLSEGMIGLAMKDQRSVVMASLSPEAAQGLGYYDGEAPARAFLAVPLMDEGVLRGVLAVDRVEPGEWPPQEQSSLEFSARQLVQLWQQSAAFGRVQAQGKRTSRLSEVNKVLASEIDRERLLIRFPELLASLVSYDSYVLALREDEQGAFSLAAKQGYRDDWDGGRALAEEGVVGRFVGLAGESMAFNSGAESQVPPFLIEGLEQPADNFLLVPLNLSGRFSGLLKMDRRGKPFTAADRELALIFANQAATTLENARLYSLHRRMATTDGLTGLYNHRYFQERLALEIEKATREHGSVALALTDIDFFKKFNDTFGHQEGDVVLKKVARLLEEKVRPGKDVVCRYGGEEFVIILPACDIVEARQVTDALRDYCAKNLIGGTGPEARAITMSIGLCVYPVGAQDQRTLIHMADEALYKAKKNGRNQVCSYKDLP